MLVLVCLVVEVNSNKPKSREVRFWLGIAFAAHAFSVLPFPTSINSLPHQGQAIAHMMHDPTPLTHSDSPAATASVKQRSRGQAVNVTFQF